MVSCLPGHVVCRDCSNVPNKAYKFGFNIVSDILKSIKLYSCTIFHLHSEIADTAELTLVLI